MKIRKSNKNDALGISLLAKHCYKTVPYPEYKNKKYWRHFIKNNYSWVCIHNNKIIGHIGIKIANNIATLCKDLISKNYQKKGIYTKLNNFRMNKIKKMKIKKIQIYTITNVSYTQKYFMEKLKFKPYGLKIGEVKDIQGIGQKESLVILKKGFKKPVNKPKSYANLIPINYNEYNETWEYSEIPLEIDMFKIKLFFKIKKYLKINPH